MTSIAPVGKPDCACGHGHFFHMPKCVKCGCARYKSKEEVTITDVIEKTNAVASTPIEEKKPEVFKPTKPVETVELICLSCAVIEAVSPSMTLPLWHRHEERLVRLVPYKKV